MNTQILSVLVRDYLKRAWLSFVGMMAGLVIAPVGLYGLIQWGADGDIRDGINTVTMHLSLHLLILLAFVSSGVIAHQGTRRRLFQMPLSTKAIVTWQMTSVAITVVAGSLLTQFILGLFFPYDWPWVGPTACMVVLSLVGACAFWLVEPFGFRRFAAALLGIAGCVVWFVSRYFPNGFSSSHQFWNTCTTGEWAVLATVAIAAWVTGVYLVSRLRCQDAEITEAARRVEEWFRSLFDSRGDQGFASAEAALQWQHWKFRIQPLLWSVGLFFGLFLTLVSLSIDDPRPGKDLEAFSVLFTFFPVLGGMITGGTMALFSNKASSDVIPSHLGVLPLSTRDFADVHLRSLMKATTLTWLVNIGVGSLCLLGRELFGRGAFHERALDGWLYDQAGVFTLPLVLLMSLTVTWIVAGLTASLAWSGREKFTEAVSMMIIFSLIANLILFRFFLPTLSFDSPLRLSIHAAYALIAIGVLVALSTISARRQLLRLDRFSMAIAGWIAVGVASWIVLPWSIGHRCCVLLLLSMVALPFGAAPVALATNRHR